jgi:hypothetical protein
LYAAAPAPLYKNRGERRLAVGALVASSLSLLLQLNLIALSMHYVRPIIWTAIAVCAALIWSRENTKMSSTVAAAVAFAAAIPAALSLQLLR